MKRPFSFFARPGALVVSGTALIAATYGLVRLAYGLFLPDVQRTLSLGDGPAGLIAAGSSLVYCVGSLVGFLLAPTRPRTTVALASASAGLGVAGMATSATSAVFGITTVVASAGAGLASPALVRLVQRDLPAARADRAQAVVNSGTGPGLVVAGLLALVLLPDWRTAWTAAAVVTVLAGAAVLVADAYTHPRRHVREDHPQPVGLPPWSWFVAHGRLVVVALLLGTGSAAVWTYGRSLLVDAGAPASLSVLAWTALGVGGAAVALTARVLGRLRARTAWTVTSAAVAVATLGLGLAPVAPPAALVALALVTCVLFGWGYTAATGALIAWTTDVDAGRAASGTSVLFVVLVLGQALGAAAAGTVVATVGTGPVFAAATAVVAAAALLTVRAPAGRGTRPGPARRSSPHARPGAPAAGGGSRARGTR
ncbi:MFS transporter [Curtobacterium sp. MCBD17_023]|uniref:MFS transporter n=1 Tax=Curtobacterium sp. MCBD17_023 TaxID=2175657 RepID=UPI000D9799DF|nr:MFS transporter [Curtobacterium sp. MCBD17_023]PYY45473.1 MFS transporter [Curtobacterium sp. MCBD17_023]